MDTARISEKFCLFTASRADMPPQAAKLGAWIIGVANAFQSFPIEVSIREIADGINRKEGAAPAPPAGINRKTIEKTLSWLSTHGVISVSEGKAIQNGSKARMIYWRLV